MSKVAFIKIDVEGHELSALTGLKCTLMFGEPIIAFECSSEEFTNGTTPVVDMLKSCGYTIFYEFARKGKFDLLPQPLRIIAKGFRLIFAGQLYALRKINVFEIKNYRMIIASKYQLDSHH